MVKVNPMSSFEYIWLYLSTRCCIPSFKVIGLLVPKKSFRIFYHKWSWKPSWSCDQEHLNKFSSEAPDEIWLQKALWFLGKIILTMLNLSVLGQKVNEWSWPWVVINHHVLIYFTICTNFHPIGSDSFLDSYSLSIIQYKNKRTKFGLAVK